MGYVYRCVCLTLAVLSITAMIACFSFASIEISIIRSGDNEPYNEAMSSFLQTMRELGWSYKYNNIMIKGGIEIDIVKETRGSDLILTMGTKATLATKEVVGDIPIIFCMALNPVSSGIVRNMNLPGENITGASLDIPLKTQFKHIKLIITNAETIGVIYNPQETKVIVQEAFDVAKHMNLKLIAKPISSERDVPDALKNMLGKVDVLWSVADGTVFGAQSTQYILFNTLKAEMPFMGLSPSFVKAGALMALACNNGDVGKQAAEIANRVLNGENPGNIAIAVPRKVSFWLNLRTADQIGLRIPDHAIKSADKVIR